MSISCPHCGAKLHLDRMQFASRLPLQVKCWNCSSTVKLGSPAAAELDSASDAQPDSASGVREKPAAKKRLDSPTNTRVDSPTHRRADSPSNHKVGSPTATALESSSAAKEDSTTAVGRVSRSNPRADSPAAKQLESPTDEMGPPTIAVSSAKPHERSKDARMAGARDSRTSSLTLPQDKTIKISVMTGPSRGKEFDLSRPLVTIGRLGGGADIEVDDAEVSRVHCAVEVRHDTILLHDMRSTNGTYIGDSRVFSARLEDGSTFRVGSTILHVSFLSATVGRRTP